MSNFRGESADFVGQELEEAYAAAFAGEIKGGHHDHGRDLKIDDQEVPFVQVKSSLEGAKQFFRESLRREEFIPICIGEPGTKEEMITTIKRFGAWVGREIPGREAIMVKVAQVRELCYNKSRLLEELGT